jgi:hypothetical protein
MADKKREMGKVNSDIPKNLTLPRGAGQTSGKIRHSQMHMAPKVENLKDFSEKC